MSLAGIVSGSGVRSPGSGDPWRLALESIGDGVIPLDGEGRGPFANAAASEITGY